MRTQVKLKIVLYGLMAIVFLCAVYVYYEIQKPAQVQVSTLEKATILNTDDLIGMFQSDESYANATLVEKVIEVKGVIQGISFLNNRHTILLKSKNSTKSFVMCDMSPQGLYIENLSVGDTITLRGICKGYLLDVIMLNCVPINEKPKK